MNDTIMIVDDIKSNIYMLADILDNNFKVIPVTGGADAISMLAARKVDLMLLDIFMPGIDGFDVLRFMKEHKEFADIPVILTSGDGEGAEEKGLVLGADDYLKKPYNADIVRLKVGKHMELKAYRESVEDIVQERTGVLAERVRVLEKDTSRLASSRSAIIMGMALMSESHDELMSQHIDRIKRITRILTDMILDRFDGLLTPELAEQIVLFSPLHDVGKVGISDPILKKTGLYTPQDYNLMKSHTIDGVELLKKTQMFMTGDDDDKGLQVAIEIAGSHHERSDGSGYPFGLTGEEIPISARITAIADVYDALRQTRPYKSAVSHAEAVSIINAVNSRTKSQRFDPNVLQAFNSVTDKIDSLYRARL